MATPPPLPIPQPVGEPTTPLSTLLGTLSNALPDMNAEVANAIARSPGMTPDSALAAGQATQAFTVSSDQVQNLASQPAATQSAVWNTSTAQQQQMLTAAGYHAPHHGGGLLSSIGHDFGMGVKDVLHAAGAPLRAVQHVERTLLAPPRSGDQAGFWGNLFSPQNWADAWAQTSNGERYIMPSTERQVKAIFDDNTYHLALHLATGTDPNQLIQAAYKFNGDTAASALAQQMKSPQVVQATRMLQAGHLSVGRMLAYNMVSPTAHPALFNTLSGLTDGTLDWFGDPLVVGAKTGMLARTAKYNIRDSIDVLNAYNRGPAFRRGLDFIAEHHDNPAAIAQQFPRLPTPILEQIAHRAPSSAEEALNIFTDNATIKSLVDYAPSQLPGRAGGGWLPVLSTTGQMRLALKGQLTKAIDWSADGSALIEGVVPGDLVPHALTPYKNVIQAGSQPAGMFVKRITRLTPPQKFDAYGPRAANVISDIAAMGVTGARERQLVNDFLAATDLGGKRIVYTNMMKDIFARLGVGDTPYGQQWLRNFATPGSEENPVWAAKYAPGSIDLANLGHGPEPVGLSEQHLVTEWPVPDFKVLYAQAKKLGVIHAAMGIPNYRLFDGFMQDVWKPLALARIGFSLRVAGEELFGAILRHGPANLARARLAATALKADSPIEPGNVLLDPLQRYYAKITSHLPAGWAQDLATHADVVASNLGAIAARGMRGAAGALAGRQYMNAVRIGFENEHFTQAYNEWVSAHHGAGFLDGDTEGRRIDIMRHGQLQPAKMVATGSYGEANPGAGEVFAPMWYDSLHEIANSAWQRTALQTMDQPYTERLQAVADSLEANPAMASRSPLWNMTTDERRVSEGEATRREALVDWARRIIDNVDANVRAPLTRNAEANRLQIGGHIEITPGHTLAQHLLDVGRPPSIAVLESVPDELKPLSVKGPVMVPVLSPDNFLAKLGELWNKGIDRGFNVITRQINWISRTPIYLHNYAKSLEAYGFNLKTGEIQGGLAASWQRMGMPEANIRKLAADGAADRATSLTTPYIHNPQLRSQFSRITRNLMPFWFAQEQFYKRWARNMVYSPWSFRQAQLISQGVQHSGFVHKDPTTGQEYFVYPGSAAVQDVLTRALSAFGYKSYLPIGAALRGQVNQASPGLERLGLPSYGPLVVIPANLVKQWFPELQGPITTLEGPQAASSTFVRSLVPTTITRLWQDFTSSPNNSAQYSSAMMQAIQYLEATGHGLGTVALNNLGQVKVDGIPPVVPTLHPGDYVTNVHNDEYVFQADGTWKRNDPKFLAEYQARVKNWTRVFLITRTLFGFTGPASPQGLFDPNHVNEDLQGLLKTLPFNDALAVFMKEHPDASAYTVFQTASQSGDPLPATKDAMAFLTANSGFMGNHPLAGAYFLPAVDTTGKFDLQTYQTQLAEQLRLRKTPQEFWTEVAYATAATTYFNAEDRKNQMLNNPGSSGLSRGQINQMWVQASNQFLQANPLFAKQLGVTPDTPGSLTGGESTTYSRAKLFQDLHDALTDPDVPQTQQTESIRTLFNSYVALEAMIAPYGTPGAPTMGYTQRLSIETAYANQVQAFVKDHPEVQALYQRLIRPTLSTVLSTEAQVA